MFPRPFLSVYAVIVCVLFGPSWIQAVGRFRRFLCSTLDGLYDLNARNVRNVQPRHSFNDLDDIQEMGFFKRFFSLGSRKSKRKNDARATQVDPSGRLLRTQEPWQQDQEGDVTRLLRSSSTHFSVVNEVDYSTLPPLRKPFVSTSSTLDH